MDSTAAREIAHDFSPFFLIYKDNTVEPLTAPPPHAPPSPSDPTTASKDIAISSSTAARIYLPKATTTTTTTQKLPILLYFHGGGFCAGSAFSANTHRFITALSSQSNSIAVSVEYRLAPKHFLPAAYDDCWSALQWVASHAAAANVNTSKLYEPEPWLSDHGDFTRVFIAGDSAGGNIAHNIVMKAGRENLPNGVRILGAIVSHAYFWNSGPFGTDPVSGHEERVGSRLWRFVYPSCPGGLDDPTINPWGPGAPSLAGLGCLRLLVCVAEKDPLRERNLRYYEAVKESGWRGEVEFYEAKGEGHVFHIAEPESDSTEIMIKRWVSFIRK
ncbi:hypothetical protein RHMOL_Rhmol02G0024700 [Rhododendron molle]|uniref:Uncharacterized protein n=1 Tax=Rhododendron molle TaxID=49168 RepID=A0ACC0PM99_RHOML|nr:hypothetical protein RHMOL_Rhmol02G0024700 [Rhododendron molle]